MSHNCLQSGKILLVGNQNVGKTTIISTFLGYDTIEFSSNPSYFYKEKFIHFDQKDEKDRKESKKNKVEKFGFSIYDTNGLPYYRYIALFLSRNVDVVFLVYNRCRKETFEQIINFWHFQIGSINKNIVFVLVGTFSEFTGCSVEVTDKDIEQFMSYSKIPLEFKISSMKYEQVNEIFNKVGVLLYKKANP